MKALHDKKALRDALAAHPIFASLPPEAHQKIVDESMIVNLAPGDFLYRAGAPAQRVFVVLSGSLQIEHPPEPADVRGFVVALFAAPFVLGEAQVMQRMSWSGTGVALSPLAALALTKEQLESLMLDNARFALELYRDLTLRFLTYINARKVQPILSPAQLIARYLLAYHQLLKNAGHAEPIDIPIPQVELGRATGLRRETVNRTLKSMVQEQRLEVGSRGLTEIRRDRLSELLEGLDLPDLLQGLSPVYSASE